MPSSTAATPARTRSAAATAATPTPAPAAAQHSPPATPASGLPSRRANGWTPTPAEKASAVIRPAKPADSVRALVTSSGRTTMARATDPNTIGLAGATVSQNRQVRTGAGGQPAGSWALAGLAAGDTPAGARQTRIAA